MNNRNHYRHEYATNLINLGLTSLIFGLAPSGRRRVYWAMAPVLLPTHMIWPEEDTATAVTTSFLSERGAYIICELVWSAPMGQIWTTPVVDPSRMAAAAPTSSPDLEPSGMNRMKLGDDTDIDMGLSCRLVRISKTLTRGSGTYCNRRTGVCDSDNAEKVK